MSNTVINITDNLIVIIYPVDNSDDFLKLSNDAPNATKVINSDYYNKFGGLPLRF